MRPKHFTIEELVSPELYEMVHEDALWKLFNSDFIEGLDYLKEVLPKGSIIINTWKWGGGYTQSGIRTKGSQYYREGSEHSSANAIDLKFTAYTVQEVFDRLRNDPKITLYFSRMEHIHYTPTWIHLDQGEHDGSFKYLYVFKP